MAHTGYTGDKTFDDIVTASEGIRQVAVAAAGASQSTVRTAEIVHYRTCLASALARGHGVASYMAVLKSLGVTGQ
jgi:hypothetical protein